MNGATHRVGVGGSSVADSEIVSNREVSFAALRAPVGWDEVFRRMKPGDTLLATTTEARDIRVAAWLRGFKVATRTTRENLFRPVRAWLVSKGSKAASKAEANAAT